MGKKTQLDCIAAALVGETFRDEYGRDYTILKVRPARLLDGLRADIIYLDKHSEDWIDLALTYRHQYQPSQQPPTERKPRNLKKK